MKDFLKKILKLLPIPLTKNHKYDLQTKKIINRLSEDSNCIDVGCYKGEILDLIIQAAPYGNHFGIEPIPRQYDFLTSKFKKNPNCKILNLAAANKSGVTSFNYVITNPSYSGIRKREYDRTGEKDTTIEVETELLDNIIPTNLKIDLIKIDVEGAELLVLKGASKIISQYRPLVIFEHGLGASDYYDTSPNNVYKYFKSKSMKVSTLGSFLKGRESLSLDEFNDQYYNRTNYYFIAHV